MITLLGALFLFATVYVVVMNWACAIASLRNQRKGVDRHHSMVPVVSVWLAVFAMLMWPYWPGTWVLLLPGLDIANLNLVFCPLYLIPRFLRTRHSQSRDKDSPAIDG